jgi:uncharacterized protein YcbX
MLKISQLYIYPVKSLRGISMPSAMVTDRGFKYDRRWMIVDSNNSFLTLRQFPKMSFLKVGLMESGLKIESLEHIGNYLEIPFVSDADELESVTIWNAKVEAKRVGKVADHWFSDMLGSSCKLVYMPESSMRPVDTTSGYAPKGKFTSFADAYPFMMIGESSLEDLNTRIQTPVTISRFRPNIVFSGGMPYQEDTIEDFTINSIHFTGLENCKRCKIPNIDPEKGELSKDKEPLRTLSRYRMVNKKIEFGRNVVHSGTGILSVGDELQLVK